MVSAGCSAAHHGADASTTSTTQAGPNPDVVPAVITPAYVDAVFVVLNRDFGNATRTLFQAGAVTGTVTGDLRAIFAHPLYEQEVGNAGASLKLPQSNLRHPPGDIVTMVTRLFSASSSCVFVQTRSDFSAVLVKPSAPAASEYWALQPKQASTDPRHINPTPWALSFNADYLTPTTIPDQCLGH
jgi:hypothetical protein